MLHIYIYSRTNIVGNASVYNNSSWLRIVVTNRCRYQTLFPLLLDCNMEKKGFFKFYTHNIIQVLGIYYIYIYILVCAIHLFNSNVLISKLILLYFEINTLIEKIELMKHVTLWKFAWLQYIKISSTAVLLYNLKYWNENNASILNEWCNKKIQYTLNDVLKVEGNNCCSYIYAIVLKSCAITEVSCGSRLLYVHLKVAHTD